MAHTDNNLLPTQRMMRVDATWWRELSPRRRFLRHLLRLSVFPLGLSVAFPRTGLAAEPEPPIRQPPDLDTKHYVSRAFEMRELADKAGDQAYGAVIVKDNRIVGQAPSRVVVNQDPTAHAEMEAIRDAARRLGSRDLSDCTMYSSSRPCPMCEAAAYWANIENMVYGSGSTDAGPPRLGRC